MWYPAKIVLSTCLSSLLLLSSPQTTALAAPVQPTADAAFAHANIEKRALPSITEVEEIMVDFTKLDKFAKSGMPPKDTAVYFTSQTDANAMKDIKAWVEGKGLTHVGMIWKDVNLTFMKNYKILGVTVSASWFRPFQVAFSRYFASKTSGTAYLFMPRDPPAAARASSIFYEHELQQMIDGGVVDKIIWLDQSRMNDATYDWAAETMTYWVKGEPKPNPA